MYTYVDLLDPQLREVGPIIVLIEKMRQLSHKGVIFPELHS